MIKIEKIPQGVQVTVTPSGAKKPVTFVIQPGQLGLITEMLRTAMSAETFKFELQL